MRKKIYQLDLQKNKIAQYFRKLLVNFTLTKDKNTKAKRIQKLGISKISKNIDFIKTITKYERFNIKKIFNLIFKIII